MIEIQVSGLMVGSIFGMIIGAGLAFCVVWSAEESRPDRFSAGWAAGKDYGQMQAMIGQGDLDERLLSDMERRGTIKIVKEDEK